MNILSRHFHTAYEAMLCSTGHQFYAHVNNQGWNSCSRPLPSNYHQFFHYLDLARMPKMDLALAHTVDDLQLYAQFNLPVVLKIHVMAAGRHISLPGAGGVSFSSPEAANLWLRPDLENISSVIRHGIDVDFYSGYQNKEGDDCLIVLNGIDQRDNATLTRTCTLADEFKVNLVGAHNRAYPFSIGEAASHHALRDAYQSHKIYLNVTNVVCMSTLEAMATGMPVILFPHLNHLDLFDASNSYPVKSIEEAQSAIHHLLSDAALRQQLGAAAQQTVLKHFSVQAFTEGWNNLFQRTYEAYRFSHPVRTQ